LKTFQDGMKVWGTSRNAKIQGKWWSPLQHEFCVLFNFFAQTWHLGMYWKKTISSFSKRSCFTSNMGIQQCHNVITIKIVTLLKRIIKDLLCQKLVCNQKGGLCRSYKGNTANRQKPEQSPGPDRTDAIHSHFMTSTHLKGQEPEMSRLGDSFT